MLQNGNTDVDVLVRVRQIIDQKLHNVDTLFTIACKHMTHVNPGYPYKLKLTYSNKNGALIIDVAGADLSHCVSVHLLDSIVKLSQGNASTIGQHLPAVT